MSHQNDDEKPIMDIHKFMENMGIEDIEDAKPLLSSLIS